MTIGVITCILILLTITNSWDDFYVIILLTVVGLMSSPIITEMSTPTNSIKLEITKSTPQVQEDIPACQ